MGLEVIGHERTNGRVHAVAICFCGKKFKTRPWYLDSGHTKSCGCLRGRGHSGFKKTHGKTESREYAIWSNAKDRCYRKKNPHYKNYGGRGISMCDEWVGSFESFLNDMGPCPDGFSLERKDNDLGYSKDNCRWANWKDQCNNRRSNVIVNIFGEEMNVGQAAAKFGLRYSTVWARLKRGLSGEDLVRQPPNLGESQ